jgi:hypothetical protein
MAGAGLLKELLFQWNRCQHTTGTRKPCNGVQGLFRQLESQIFRRSRRFVNCGRAAAALYG